MANTTTVINNTNDAGRRKARRTTSNFVVSGYVPLKTLALLDERARELGLNRSQYINQLITSDLRDSGTTLEIGE